ncbi:MAG TPA: flagellar basal body rod protein FlgF [Gammaproteobacteria bacterium]|nr:flagellar basal body rod protein FlgF [Gammaproteobacteria bacterium]
MDRMLFIAMNGARQTMAAQAINSNNLANASTTGFKSDFQNSLSQRVYGPGLSSRVYATVENAGVDLAQGSIVSTGRDLDVAVNGKGWIAVQAADGSEAYTRAGDLKVDNLGRLTNGAGYMILGDGGPISVPENAKLDIGGDGTISVLPIGQPVNSLATVDRIKLVNPPDNLMIKGTDGLMHMKGGGRASADASVQLVSGSLESSNVNTVSTLVRMIELARQYETNIKLMKTAEDTDRASAQIVKMS